MSHLNAFTGPDALKDFHNPDKNVYTPVVELPVHRFTGRNVRIYAKMMNMVPSFNVKALPALNMMLRGQESDSFQPNRDKIVEYSSGNTILSLGILNSIYSGGAAQTEAYVSNKTSIEKLQLLRLFGIELTLFGGPAQVEPADVYGGIYASIREGERPNTFNPGQYSNYANSEAHIRWTGPQIAKQIPEIGVFACGIGTSGTLTGTGTYLKSYNPRLLNIGIFVSPDDRVPGPRPINLVQTVDLPWKEIIDHAEDVSSLESYGASMELCRMGILCGPSSGLALRGLEKFIEKNLDALNDRRGKDGYLHFFICCDLPFGYIKEYFQKLPPAAFPPIHGESLLNVDIYPYSTDWELRARQICEILASDDVLVLDLRSKADFAKSHVRRSLHLDLEALAGGSNLNPFEDNETLSQQWQVLVKELDRQSKYAELYSNNRRVVIISTNGHSAYVACSVTRRFGAHAYWLRDGWVALVAENCGVTMESGHMDLTVPTEKGDHADGFYGNRTFFGRRIRVN